GKHRVHRHEATEGGQRHADFLLSGGNCTEAFLHGQETFVCVQSRPVPLFGEALGSTW
ncbi:unnamed protein product, partial [Ectocarpus sp. 8 AP-2014]